MRSKTDFYRLFFEQLARRGFDVKRSQSSDYIADIYFKNQLVAYFSKADTVIQNPFVTVKDKLIRLINDTAQDTANKAGICRDCPYTDANEKLPNGSYKLAEYNGVTLACKEHHLFGYVFSTYRTAPDSGEMMARQIFYNKEFAGQDFAKRSGLVDERALFTEEELRVLHAGLVKMSMRGTSPHGNKSLLFPFQTPCRTESSKTIAPVYICLQIKLYNFSKTWSRTQKSLKIWRGFGAMDRLLC